MDWALNVLRKDNCHDWLLGWYEIDDRDFYHRDVNKGLQEIVNFC